MINTILAIITGLLFIALGAIQHNTHKIPETPKIDVTVMYLSKTLKQLQGQLQLEMNKPITAFPTDNEEDNVIWNLKYDIESIQLVIDYLKKEC